MGKKIIHQKLNGYITLGLISELIKHIFLIIMLWSPLCSGHKEMKTENFSHVGQKIRLENQIDIT